MSESADFQAARARFERLWPNVLPMLLGIFRRKGLAEHAQDLAQQVALRLMMRLDKISSDEQMKAYALTAARWIMADYWRTLPPVEAAIENAPEEASHFDAPADALEARQTARAVLEGLTPRENEVVTRLTDGQSIAEIARAMGITVATVRSLLRFARHRILTLLANGEGPEEEPK
ncbi:MAG: sigma-70 family RNA polymerase sigma factor [Gammaproteobacteria bacterium]|nr:sigma-70 family RNA polymerase sigma factor [Gammaproteobacteria bacterium]